MFSWRLDNDHTPSASKTDIDPTFQGADTLYQSMIKPLKG